MESPNAEIRLNFSNELSHVTSSQELENLKTKFLGKKGPIQQLMKELQTLAPEARREAGKAINDLKEQLQSDLEAKSNALIQAEEAAAIAQESIDISFPGTQRFNGRKHVVTQMLDQMIDILAGMGFSVVYGPDVDSDYYVFEALNISADHPARDMQDTFYITDKMLLRTQTSNIQVRVMESNNPPIRIITPGKAYRNEDISARSHVFFHQLEAVYIDKGVSFADLMGTLKTFLQKLFYSSIETRFRPSYFPFVEPGMEVDVRCLSCQGSGCTLCKQSGWLEVLGAGMIHPEVLKNGGIDPEVYTGFAWGMGIERLALLKYGIPDIRYFTENDLRFLRQFTAV